MTKVNLAVELMYSLSVFQFSCRARTCAAKKSAQGTDELPEMFWIALADADGNQVTK